MNRRTAIATAVAGSALAAAAVTGVGLASADPAAAAAISNCTGPNLVEGYQRQVGAGGHDGLVLEFRNRGSHTCTLHGYPGFDARQDGKVVAHAKRTYFGYLGGSRDRTVPDVHLRPGHYASATVEWVAIDSYRPSGDCREEPAFAFTAPGTTNTQYRKGLVMACDLEVHPVVYGRSGRHG